MPAPAGKLTASAHIAAAEAGRTAANREPFRRRDIQWVQAPWQLSWKGIAMNPNVHALDRARVSLSEIQRPSRAEVESAVRTIIRWTSEDPDRDGLRETPARVTRAFEEFFAGLWSGPR
jgi:hypothetical protein